MKKSILWLMVGALLVIGLPIASAQSGETINRENLSQLSVVATIEGNYGEKVDLSPSGRLLALAEGLNEVRLYDLEEPNEPLMIMTTPDFGVQAVDISPDETLVAAGTTEGRVYIIDIRRQKITATFEGHEAYVFAVAWSPDGERLASAGDDSTILIWDVPSGESPLRLEFHQDWVRSLAWSPDGDFLASASDDQTAVIWDAATGEVLTQLAGHTDWVRSVAWSSDGKLIATGSDDKTIKVWNAEDGALLLTLNGHQDFVRSVAFGPESDVLFSASDDSTVRAWSTTSSQSLATVLEGEFVQFLTLSVAEEGNRLAVGGTDGRIIVLGLE
ncbi:MAG: hypothetical protein CUN56_00450 [Phototrophicales bacterium]|nr:MAG: hypothetical protein CUN56_00450 [Phototrophicales bacterium]